MLQYKLLSNHAGITLIGNEYTLRKYAAFAYDVSSMSPTIVNREGILHSLMGDINHAITFKIIHHCEKLEREMFGQRYAVHLIWPVILMQSRLLRDALAFIESTKEQQALIYALEALIESALRQAFGDTSVSIVEQWMNISTTDTFAEEKFHSRGAQFCLWTKSQRKEKLAALLASLNICYQNFFDMYKNDGVKFAVNPDQLDKLANSEWVDP